LKSIDNIALPKVDDEEGAVAEDENKEAKFQPIQAILNIHELTIDMRDETNRETVKIIFYDFKCNWQKNTPTAFTTDLILGAIEAVDSLEAPETHMLR
jgi:hypothetical protein